jgi:hypothetical protein
MEETTPYELNTPAQKATVVHIGRRRPAGSWQISWGLRVTKPSHSNWTSRLRGEHLVAYLESNSCHGVRATTGPPYSAHFGHTVE